MGSIEMQCRSLGMDCRDRIRPRLEAAEIELGLGSDDLA